LEEVGGELTQAFLSCLVTEKFSEDDGKLKIDLHFLSWDVCLMCLMCGLIKRKPNNLDK
jgi:hypothetical protein